MLAMYGVVGVWSVDRDESGGGKYASYSLSIASAPTGAVDGWTLNSLLISSLRLQ